MTNAIVRTPARRLAAGLLLLSAGLFAGSLAVGEDALDALEKAIEHPDVGRRLAALEGLEAFPRNVRAERAALAALRGDDWSVQIRAAAALAKIGGDAAVDPLLDVALRGEIQRVRAAATAALVSLPHEGVAQRLFGLTRTARETSDKARAVELAGRLAPADLVGKFREYTHHKEVQVAAAAARALGWVGSSEAARAKSVELLDDLLREREERRRFTAFAAALEALGRIDSAESRALLVREVLLQEDEDGYVPERVGRSLRAARPEDAATAIRAGLAEAKKPAALRRLLRLVADARAAGLRAEVEAALAEKDEPARAEAVRTLGVLADPASAAPLQPLLDDKDADVRLETVTSLARTLPPAEFLRLGEKLRAEKVPEIRLQYVVEVADLGDPAAIPTLGAYLTDPDWRVASAAAVTVGTLGISSDLTVLEPLLDHASWKIRAAAFEGMARLRAARAIPLLAEGLVDKDPVVRGVCHANLQILTKERLGEKPDRWRDWWKKNGKDLVLVKRSRRTAEEVETERKTGEEALEKSRYAHEKDELTRAREARKRSVEILQKARIIVVIGAWDKVQVVLGHLSIPHTLLRAQELKGEGLNPNQLLLVNCEGNMDKDSQDRVRWFVNVGGYLMTTDWALTHTLEPAFPGYVKQFSGSSTGNDVVVVEPAMLGHPWTAGIFDDVPALMWWLEIQAFPIRVASPRRCDVIVDSAAMRQRYGSSPMAVAFRWGLGKIQHSISHFYLQEEGMQQTSDPRKRMIFAADHLGISLEQIRLLAERGRWGGQLNEETMKEIAPDYSMFRLIVNVVKEKAAWVENL